TLSLAHQPQLYAAADGGAAYGGLAAAARGGAGGGMSVGSKASSARGVHSAGVPGGEAGFDAGGSGAGSNRRRQRAAIENGSIATGRRNCRAAFCGAERPAGSIGTLGGGTRFRGRGHRV